MGLPIVGQVSLFESLIEHFLQSYCQHYNLVSLAFYLGFLFWEFPTSYISQKLPLAKYLGMYR